MEDMQVFGAGARIDSLSWAARQKNWTPRQLAGASTGWWIASLICAGNRKEVARPEAVLDSTVIARDASVSAAR